MNQLNINYDLLESYSYALPISTVSYVYCVIDANTTSKALQEEVRSRLFIGLYIWNHVATEVGNSYMSRCLETLCTSIMNTFSS